MNKAGKSKKTAAKISVSALSMAGSVETAHTELQEEVLRVNLRNLRKSKKTAPTSNVSRVESEAGSPVQNGNNGRPGPARNNALGLVNSVQH